MKIRPLIIATIIFISPLHAATQDAAITDTDSTLSTTDSSAKDADTSASIDDYQYISDEWSRVLNRNGNVVYEIPTRKDWIRMSGFVMSHFMRSNADNRFMSGPSHDLWLSRLNFYVQALFNSWLHGHLAISYNETGNWFSFYDPARYRREPDEIDEAFFTIAKFDKSPFYLRGGREYVKYGKYERNHLPASLPQLLTVTQVPAIEGGFVDLYGFNGAVYVFNASRRLRINDMGEFHKRNTAAINDAGATLGFHYENPSFLLDASGDWMYNIAAGVNFIRDALDEMPGRPDGHLGRVHGAAANIDAAYRWADIVLRYTRALSKFNRNDLFFKWRGAQPSAWLAGGGLSFHLWGIKTRLGGSYQKSYEAVDLDIPRRRVQGDLQGFFGEHFELGLHVMYDSSYRHFISAERKENAWTGLLTVKVKIFRERV